ncbi:unnamed protein product (macronuclear) [Paramecium tetraurelia]|uniref:Cyclic nucleotide-binding domain-containing protein n=1 Tax=Paramecium tetraurelia TaxID=5888 RepID=A0DX09_PARTE|nr:uncharacterized protein GSPATT00021208001 [Paramecium tetraurelia]CAK87576.1 unnamed protein product [Paramecium tetraurelia]|eukprot:XP_001454973.1 hypothetical protein (macronuclear) [Paramecium tetraurelia strain d4-2]
MQEILKQSQQEFDPKRLSQISLTHQGIKRLNQLGGINCSTEYIEKIHYAEYEEGQEIIRTGESGHFFYLLIEGEINIKKSYFGAEALINLPYIQTINSITKTKLGRINKCDFEYIRRKAKLKDTNEQLEFFRQSQLFGQLSKAMIDKLLKNCQIETFDRNQLVYYEGDPSSAIYLVRDGIFQLQKKMVVGNKWKNITISEIGIYQLFGDLECLLNKQRYFTVKCLKQGSCYKISNEDFYQKVISDQPSQEAKTYINQYVRTQQLNRNERIERANETLAHNSEYLIGLPVMNNQSNKELSQIEMSVLDKTHTRYAQIYNSACQKRVKVRYATTNKTDVAVSRVTSKKESINKTIFISIEKPQKQSIYDEIKMPDIVQRRYRNILPQRKKDFWIITQNNKSSIL